MTPLIVYRLAIARMDPPVKVTTVLNPDVQTRYTAYFGITYQHPVTIAMYTWADHYRQLTGDTSVHRSSCPELPAFERISANANANPIYLRGSSGEDNLVIRPRLLRGATEATALDYVTQIHTRLMLWAENYKAWHLAGDPHAFPSWEHDFGQQQGRSVMAPIDLDADGRIPLPAQDTPESCAQLSMSGNLNTSFAV